eukprot:scaffold201351_cov36-Cyclotella_meneghiniana.AAC.1
MKYWGLNRPSIFRVLNFLSSASAQVCALSKSSTTDQGTHSRLRPQPQPSNNYSISHREASMDRYELSAQIGDGSFGRVMKAKSKETGAL